MTSSTKHLVLFLSSFLVIELINVISVRALNIFGLFPRSLSHIGGILISPWLHGNLEHFIANYSALLFLGLTCWQWGDRRFWKTTIFIIAASGLLVWLFGRPAFHIGASGLIYGYFGFALIGGWLSRRFVLMLVSSIVVFLYGSMLWGVLPIKAGTSFEYHLAGFICGLLAAKWWASLPKA